MSSWIDISVPLGAETTRWPGDPRLVIGRFSSIAAGDDCNVSSISMCAHAGTHVDAPVHFVDRGIDVAHVPFDYFAGPARVIGVKECKMITAAELRHHCLEHGERILIKTDNSLVEWWTQPFDPKFVGLSPDGAEYLVKTGVKMVGIDYLSIAPPGEKGNLVHRTLLTGGIGILEGLALGHVAWGRYDLMALPLRLEGSDGSPVRAAIRPLF